ncbi:MAG: hypothetical protein CMB37_02290 [Euryarchaeota archaeon]|nr:hypothetical protein [Euryarchaeota archaeon]
MSDEDLDWVGAAPLGAKEMERLRQDLITQRTVIWVPLGFLIALSLLYFFERDLSEPEAILTLAFTLIIGVVFGRVSGNQRYSQIQNAMMDGLDIAPLLEQEGKGVAARVLGIPGGTDILDVVMRPEKGGAMAKEKDKWGRVVYKTRGRDPKGPAEGSGADTIDSSMPRVDAMTARPEFEGLEDDLTAAEQLVEEANIAKDVKAQEAWERAESSDPDLIEAGVSKLGDLVSKGHFTENGQDEDFPVAPTRADPNTPPPSLAGQADDQSQD